MEGLRFRLKRHSVMNKNNMNKHCFLILLLIGLVGILIGCNATKKEKWRNGSSVFVHSERQGK